MVLIGVHTTNAAERMADYVAEQEIPYPVAIDVGGQTVAAFAVDSFPDYYVIDRAGKLRVADLANGDLERAVQTLLKEKAPAAKPKLPLDKIDAEVALSDALALAKKEDRKVLIHLGGPG